eukprot:NODE_6675_length_510_cov_11.135770_g6509_i0.p1 GENE.NODE_6675_length_510_cov_11.135770_g6509_i0~~NODE_6675_length_510_cov_11.135770_g6509_i0.p1  ORF type:complete len:132 (+),score=20.89 NODE_6675_length_510_cov_11.135770_g6509_i0:69-464(+)
MQLRRVPGLRLCCRALFHSLYIKDLPFDFDTRRLRALYLPFGNVTHAFVPFHPATQSRRGFGFVTFDTEEAARLALAQTDGLNLNGHVLKVHESLGTGRARRQLAEVRKAELAATHTHTQPLLNNPPHEIP